MNIVCEVNGIVDIVSAGERPNALIQAQCRGCEWHSLPFRYESSGQGYGRVEALAIAHSYVHDDEHPSRLGL